jgi:hypothetical protein
MIVETSLAEISKAVNSPAVTIMAARFERAITLDRLLQNA